MSVHQVIRFGGGFGLGVMMAVALATAVEPSAANANFGSNTASGGTAAHACDATPSSQCVANNGTQLVLMSNLQARQLNATRWVMTNVFNPVADVNTIETTSQADLIVEDGTYAGMNYWAWTQCNPSAVYGGSDPDRYCYPQVLKYNNGLYPTHFDSDLNARSIACHEFGHSMGLRHSANGDDPSWSSSCMEPNQDTQNTLTTHDKAHLTGQY